MQHTPGSSPDDAAGCHYVTASLPGTIAPDFSVATKSGTLKLSDLRGHPVILVFAPPGWDPAATEQMAVYNEIVAMLQPYGVRLLGISTEDIWCHLDFGDEDRICFPLLRDFDPAGAIAHHYDVYGQRAVFIIDAEGIIRWRHIQPAGMPPQPEALLAALQQLSLVDELLANSGEPSNSTLLPSMSRRVFLISALAATAALTIQPQRAFAETAIANPAQSAPAAVPHTIEVKLNVNDIDHTLRLDTRVTLLDALREYMGLTGTKKGCDQGTCGACTVTSDGRRIKSCLTLASMQEGRKIITIEGLVHEGKLHPVQAAFIDHDAFQCGYCTPGQIMSAVALITEGHVKSEQEIREWMSGNICRCGAYPNIVAAIKDASERAKI